jgi:hypothetical protein
MTDQELQRLEHDTLDELGGVILIDGEARPWPVMTTGCRYSTGCATGVMTGACSFTPST